MTCDGAVYLTIGGSSHSPPMRHYGRLSNPIFLYIVYLFFVGQAYDGPDDSDGLRNISRLNRLSGSACL